MAQRQAKLKRSADNLVQALAEGTGSSLIRPHLSAIQAELDRVKDQRPRRIINLTKDDVLDALREVDRLLTDAEANEASRFARGLIDKIVVDGPALAIHHSFNEPDEPGLVAQLWLPEQDSNLQPSG